MNVPHESLPASTLRRLPLLIRLAPELVNQFPALLPAARSVSGGVTGILFGRVEAEFVFVQAFRQLSSFSNVLEHSGASGGEGDWHDRIVSRSKLDAELASLA